MIHLRECVVNTGHHGGSAGTGPKKGSRSDGEVARASRTATPRENVGELLAPVQRTGTQNQLWSFGPKHAPAAARAYRASGGSLREPW